MNEAINHFIQGLNNAGGVFCGYAGAVLLQTAVLVVVLFIADLFLQRRVRAVLRYGLWMLVLVKLILPPRQTGRLFQESLQPTESATVGPF